MSRICYVLDDDAHLAFKLACIKAGETMIEANRKMAALYASGHLCTLVEADQEEDEYKEGIAISAIVEFLTERGVNARPT